MIYDINCTFTLSSLPITYEAVSARSNLPAVVTWLPLCQGRRVEAVEAGAGPSHIPGALISPQPGETLGAAGAIS